jgi:hypothetical protein
MLKASSQSGHHARIMHFYPVTRASKKWKGTSDNTIHNRIYITECGANGDCMFYVICRALKRDMTLSVKVHELRLILARYITEYNVCEFINLTQDDENISKWNVQSFPFVRFRTLHPQMVLSDDDITDICNDRSITHKTFDTTLPRNFIKRDNVKRVISREGWTYTGSDITLRYLLRTRIFADRRLGFLILSSFGPSFVSVIDTPTTEYYICMYNDRGRHWMLAGIRHDNDIATTLPKHVVTRILTEI